MAYLSTSKIIDSAFPSIVNSTSTLLTAGSTFTGESELNTDYNEVMVSVKTDQNGILYCEFSPDGNNWDLSLSFTYDTARINPPHILVKGSHYFRVRFTNTSASNQTFLRLQTSYGSFKDLTAPINGILAESYDAIAVRPTEFKYETARGKRQGFTTWNKYGYNSDIDTGAAETVWSVGGLLTRLTAASTLQIVSTSANDINTSGTGAWSIIIYGVNANFEAVTEVVNLNGTTPVVTTNSYRGINSMAIYLAGTSGQNAGNINATATTGGTTQGQIPIGEGSTQQAFFFTQANHSVLIDSLLINATRLDDGGGGAGGGSASQPIITVKGWVTNQISGAKYLMFKHVTDTAVENTIQINPSQPFVVGEKSLIEFQVETNTNNTAVSIIFSFIEGRIS